MNYISETAIIGEGTQIGLNTIVEEDVKIGKNCKIGHNVIIYKGTKIGNNVRIDDNTVIGKQPMKSKRSAISKGGIYPPPIIGNEVIIGTSVIIYAGTKIDDSCLIADAASIRENVAIGELTIVGKGVSIENNVSIGKKVKLELGCYITALSTIEDYVFIAPMVTTTNDNFMGRTEKRKKYFKGVTIKKGGRVGANSTILPGITIFEDGVVAAGSIVTHDIPQREIWAGTPAKFFKKVPIEQLLENQGENF